MASGGVMASVAGLLYLRFFSPVLWGFYPICPFYYLTGLYCPGCGTTRGLHELLHGNLLQAIDFNPLMVVTLPIIGYVFASASLAAIRGRGLPKVFVSPTIIKAIFVIVAAFWITRNIPFFPFSFLAP